MVNLTVCMPAGRTCLPSCLSSRACVPACLRAWQRLSVMVADGNPSYHRESVGGHPEGLEVILINFLFQFSNFSHHGDTDPSNYTTIPGFIQWWFGRQKHRLSSLRHISLKDKHYKEAVEKYYNESSSLVLCTCVTLTRVHQMFVTDCSQHVHRRIADLLISVSKMH